MATVDPDPEMDMPAVHRPVLVVEVLQQLNPRRDGIYLDATVGEGGHATALLESSSPSGRVLGIDLDPRSLAHAGRRLQQYGQRFNCIQGNYADMLALARANGLTQVDGVLIDLGFSARQIQKSGYGFSFRVDEPLDMRFDPESGLTAEHIVNTFPERELAQLIFQYGEEPRARAVARNLVRGRPIGSTAKLAELVAAAVGPGGGRRLHPATRTFQALRIAVNNELSNLESGLESAIQLLAPEARLVVISYHSLEDRVVKTFMAREKAACICRPEVPVCLCGHQPTLRLVNRRVIKPSAQEVQSNPRSRSARMRVAQRL
jgi:16S rRNA (cytosine1402-N4)-methyltransferase